MTAALAAAGRERRDRNPGIDRDDPLPVRQERIDVELAQLGQVGGELRDLDEDQRHGALVDGGDVAVGLEDARHARPRDQVARELQVERRQGERLVVDDLDGRAAVTEDDDGAEGWIVGNAGDQLARLRAPHHGLNGDARDARRRLQATRALEDVGGGAAHGGLARQVELHAGDVGFVHDVGRQDLHRHRAALGEDRARGLGRLVGIARQRDRRRRDVVGPQERVHLQGIEPLPAVGKGGGDDLPGGRPCRARNRSAGCRGSP